MATETPFPHADRVELAEPPIELIIAQVRFPTVARLFTNDGFVEFADAIRTDFPDASPETDVAIEVNSDAVRERSRRPVWRFHSPDRSWSLVLTPDFLALETPQYEHFSDFRDKFDTMWDRLVEQYSLQSRTRLGLRYVDRYADGKQKSLPAGWMSLIRPELFPFRALGEHWPISGTSENRFAVSADVALTMRYRYQAAIGGTTPQSEFVLDVDAYDHSRQPAASIAASLEGLRELAHNGFWWVFEGLIRQVESGDGK